MPTSLGKHNPQLAAVRELRTKKGRVAQRRFAFEGPTLLEEALAAAIEIQAVYATPAAVERYDQLTLAEVAGIAVFTVDDAAMARLTDVETPTGVLGIAAIAQTPAGEIFARPQPLAVLAGIQDPGNAGTLLRSAEAFGIGAVVFDGSSVEPHNPKVVRSAMGALFRLQIGHCDAAQAAGWLEGRTCVGLDARGGPIGAVHWGETPVIVIGSERHGLDAWRPLCTGLAAIPMTGNAESLNAGVAGSIAFYEATKRL